MNNLRLLIENLFSETEILRLIFSNPYKKDKDLSASGKETK